MFALAALVIALLRFDTLPLVHVGSESLIWASILSALALLGYVFYLVCRRLWLLYKRSYKLPVVIIAFLFASFVALYMSLNVVAQAFDPTIDKVINDLPPPGRKIVFARRRDSYEQVALPADRRISTDEIGNSSVRDAIIAVEDERLESRFGPIDLEALLRGAIKTFVLQRRREGGSTILIQAAKNILRSRKASEQGKTDPNAVTATQSREALPRALLRKCAELVLSLRLAQRFPRADEQLALYLSVAPMGGSDKDGRDHTLAYTATDLFGVSDLRGLKRTDANDVLASAMLVGMLKAPTSCHPRLHPGNAVQRRNIALSQMAKAGQLPKELSTLQGRPVKLRDSRNAKSLTFYYNASVVRGGL